MSKLGMRAAAAALAAMAILLLAGCATTGTEDQPWASPQPWEGAPNIPGFTQPR
jgi:hypothetical protein